MFRSLIVSLIVISLIITAIPEQTAAVETVRVSGSSTVMPFAELCAEEFNFLQGEYRITVSAGGTGVGITNAAEGRSDIAMASREIKADERARYDTENCRFQEFLVGYDAVIIVVSPEVFDSGVTALSREDVKKIYSGEISNWMILGGADEGIYAIGRMAGSGTRDTFNEVIMGSRSAETPGVSTEAADSAEVKNAIVHSRKAIGYLGYSFIADGGVSTVELDGVEPTVENIKVGLYPLARKLYLYTMGTPSAGAQAFIDFVRSPQGQRIASDNGFIPI